MSEMAAVPYSIHQEAVAESIGRKHRIAKLAKELSDLKGEMSKRDARIAELESSVGTLTTERDGLQTKLTAAPSELQAELDRLKGEIRQKKHQSTFDKLAKDIKPEAREAAWKLAGLKTDSEEIDEAEMSKAIASLVEANPFLKADPVGSGGGGTPRAIAIQPRTPGPGAARGGVNDTKPTVMDQVRANYEANGRTAPNAG